LPYFFDISPSDFDLFGKVKSVLIRQESPDESGLLEANAEILNDISDAEWQRIFRSWMESVERMFESGWDYLTS
jgi:hypothetical protein